MEFLYPATIYAAAVVCLLASVLLFLRRCEGERSRLILAAIVMLSVVSYTNRFILLASGEIPALVVSVPMLLAGLLMVTSYIMYPLEVISPGWLSARRIALLYLPVIGLTALWMLTRRLGVDYRPYSTICEMLPHALDFDAAFRLFLCLLVFAPIPALFFTHFSRKRSNTDRAWMIKYSAAFVINSVAYLVVLLFNNRGFNIAYYYISVGCSLYIAYMELYERIISTSPDAESGEVGEQPSEQPEPPGTFALRPIVAGRSSAVFERVDAFMRSDKAWRNPDLTMSRVVRGAYTNRTTMTQAIQEQGYDGYADYINCLRIADFISIMRGDLTENFQNAFFAAGFRSRTSAHRNFKQVTGMNATEYFQKERDNRLAQLCKK